LREGGKSLKFVKDLKGVRLNGVWIEQRNQLLYSTITTYTCILLQIKALRIRVTIISIRASMIEFSVYIIPHFA